jgi:hypothetical protein
MDEGWAMQRRTDRKGFYEFGPLDARAERENANCDQPIGNAVKPEENFGTPSEEASLMLVRALFVSIRVCQSQRKEE